MNNKIKYGCGDITMANCVSTEAVPNSQSTILEVDCPSQYEVNEDIYSQLEDIWTENDLEALGNLCLSYTLIGGKKVVKNVLLKFEEKICELQERILELETTAICSTNITDCPFDFGTLTDACDNQPQTLAETIQLILDTLNTP